MAAASSLSISGMFVKNPLEDAVPDAHDRGLGHAHDLCLRFCGDLRRGFAEDLDRSHDGKQQHPIVIKVPAIPRLQGLSQRVRGIDRVPDAHTIVIAQRVGVSGANDETAMSRDRPAPSPGSGAAPVPAKNACGSW
jgi:hypothetical protein